MTTRGRALVRSKNDVHLTRLAINKQQSRVMTSMKAAATLVFHTSSSMRVTCLDVFAIDNEGELNDHVMINHGDNFQLTANLIDVDHGTMMAEGMMQHC
ncbi:hypothetical protein J3F83DRAFT_365611 [Trichoderma novae-zelandiae]